MGGALPPRGRLEDASYPELLMDLHRAGATGALVLSRDGEVKTTYFQEGRLTFARSSNPEDRLGEFLLRRGVLGLRQYLESSRGIAPGRRQGAILCEMEAISADELVKYVKEQVAEILYSLFDWRRGEYEVREPGRAAEEMIVLTIPIEDLVVSGIRRTTSWGRIWRGLGGSPDAVFAATPTADALSYRASLSDDEAHVLSLVNGKLSVGRIVDLSYGSSFETCRALWALRVVGAIRERAAAPAEDAGEEDYELAESVEAFDRVYTFIYGFVSERIGELVDHFMDRACAEAVARHPRALADVHLRNQGRVEYEQVFANLAPLAPVERRAAAREALADLLRVMVSVTARELGPEEESFLRDQLHLLAREVPGVPVEDVLASGDGR